MSGEEEQLICRKCTKALNLIWTGVRPFRMAGVVEDMGNGTCPRCGEDDTLAYPSTPATP